MSSRRPGKIAAAAQAAQMSVLDFLTKHVEEAGTVKDAAHNIGLKSDWSVYRMLAQLGYRVETRQIARVVPLTEVQP